MAQPLSIGFVSSVFSGHCNIVFATIEYLLTTTSLETPIHVHLLSDAPLRKRAATIPCSAPHSFTFHELNETEFHDLEGKDSGDKIRSPPMRAFEWSNTAYNLLSITQGPNAGIHLDYIDKLTQVLKGLSLSLCLVDILVPLGVDACLQLGIKYGIISPLSDLDLSRMEQPRLEGFWKYPAVFTGHAYPVPWIQIPANIVAYIRLIKFITTDKKLRAIGEARKRAGITTPLHKKPGDASFVICPSVMEMEYPHVTLRNTVFCGPLVLPVPVLSSTDDADLAAFLDRGRTVHMNLGSLFTYHEEEVRSVFSAIVEAQARLQSRGGFQVLWKLPNMSQFADILPDLLKSTDGTVRLEKWIKPPSLAILQHPNVVVSVHHAGANSLHEAAYAGITQIALPFWADTWDLATRLEVLGHGIHANKNHSMHIDASQLANAFTCALCDKEGEDGHALRKRAQEIGEACRQAGGVETAAQTILHHAREK